jgi:hypothetical protein
VPADHAIEAGELVGRKLAVDAPDHVGDQVQFHLGLDLGWELCDHSQEHGELSVGHRKTPVRAARAGWYDQYEFLSSYEPVSREIRYKFYRVDRTAVGLPPAGETRTNGREFNGTRRVHGVS